MSPKNGPDGTCGTRIGFTDFLEVLNNIDGQSDVPTNPPCPSINIFIICKRSIPASASFESFKSLRQGQTKVRILRVLLDLAMALAGIAQAAGETGSKGIVVFLAHAPSRGYGSDYAIIHSLLLWLTELTRPLLAWPWRRPQLTARTNKDEAPYHFTQLGQDGLTFEYIAQSILFDNGCTYPILFLSVSGLTRGQIAD